MKNGGSFHCYVSSPEGNQQKRGVERLRHRKFMISPWKSGIHTILHHAKCHKTSLVGGFFLPLWKNDGVEWVSNSWDGWKFPTVSGKSFFPFHGSSHQQPEVDVSIKTMDLMDWWRLMSINLWLPKFHVELVMKSVQRFFAKISWQNFLRNPL